MRTDLPNRLRPYVIGALGFSLATLVLGCQAGSGEDSKEGSLNVDTDNDKRLDREALRSIPQGSHKQVCADAPPGHARCHARIRTNSDGTIQAFAVPSGLKPADLQNAYKASSGGAGVTVAIVDAYDDPNAEADLGVYRAQFGLPVCTTANGCFKKVNQTGATSPLPAADQGWAGEISLDVQMVSAICPNCKILLVEANTPTDANLGTAENTAATLGASVISNSFGRAESSTVSTSDSTYYNHPGILITASTGDNGYGVQFPASGAHVLAVGGTSLVTSGSSRGWAETVWSGAGSGCSGYFAKPSFQSDTGCPHRMEADVSAVADTNTGVAVYDSYGYAGWLVFGGTSAAAPIVAASFAAAGKTDGANSYPYSNPSAFYDVTTGSNGTCGTEYFCHGEVGYDGPTGLGTPNGTAIAAGCGSGAPPPPAWVNATDGTFLDKVEVTWSTWCATSYQLYRNSSNTSSGATQLATPSSPPYDDTPASAGATYYYFVKACNSAGCSDFSRSDSGFRATPANAVYDTTLLAPKCGTPSPFCDSGTLLVGRGTMVPAELHAPNTIANSCSDGNTGTFHSDESIDRLQITSLDGTNLAPGKAVRIDATVWAFSSKADYLDLYLTTDTTGAQTGDGGTGTPVWTLLTPTFLVPPASGSVVLSQNITLPATGATQWAIRGSFRYSSTVPSLHVPCSTGAYDDQDDLVFVVDVPPSPPTGVSGSDGSYTDKVQVSWTSSSGATSYQVYRNTSNSSAGATQIGTPSASPYDDTTATVGTTYYYFVKACNTAGCSDFSAADSGYRALSPPTGVTASDGTYTDKVRVSWAASTGATSYQVYRNTANASAGATQIGAPAASPYDDTSATPASIWYYFVKACNGAVCSDFSTSDSGYRSGAPANDDFAGAIPLGTVPFLSTVDVTNATTAGDDPALTLCSRPVGTKSVWYSYTPGTTRFVYLDTFGSSYDTMIGVFTGARGGLTAVACNDDDSRSPGGFNSGVSLNATAGTPYTIVVYSKAAVTTATLQFHATSFYDVPGNYGFWRYIEGFYSQRITTGCGATPFSYCPENAVTRAEMAVFLLRAKHGGTYQPPAQTGIFTDVPVAGKEWMQPWVEQFYREGMTTGCGSNPLRYCPEAQTTRAEMSVFVLRSTHGPTYQPPAATGIFGDLPVAGKEWMQPWVEQYYHEGITTGCAANPLRYCPENSVTRAEMAVFVSRAYALTQLP